MPIRIDYVNNESGKLESVYVSPNVLESVLTAMLRLGITVQSITD